MSSAGSGATSAVDEVIQQFATITGVESDRARFYLDSAGWDLNLALSSFYEDLPESVNLDGENPIVPSVASRPNVEAISATKPPTDLAQNNMSRAKKTGESNTKKPATSDRQIRTFRDLNNGSGSSDSEEEGQRFFAGGSEHSGQQVLGPPGRKKLDANELVQSIFEQARAHGATVSAAEHEPRATRLAFSGVGFRLGADEQQPLQKSSGTSGAPGSGVASQDSNVAGGFPVSVDISLWHDGFTVDNGPLRRYDTPEGKEFIDSIKSGVIPPELYSMANSGEVSVDLNDRRYEEYVPPKRMTKAFTGEGHRLGNVEPAVVPPKPEGACADLAACEAQASREINLDESKPTTNIQIRLADGSRLIAKLNHSNTIDDLRRYLVTARPQYAASTFVLMTTFPNKELTEGAQSLADAKLLGAVVVQRLK
ncbi:NSFL1 cofactor p47-like isoform X1 [Varroa jacobsoni]|uniref:NSFL1 cofactor p47 n=1 Tax=Varroa destructor TaxID=109461 RepID=A0A7M7MJT7_VARDE|nr:NSFL1 cofactor p47-like isoform X3 [Varroa destructor]XP_022709860.1 NSFL1 cofactor p47-like isoform X1 [Varroa jacobsoni]